MNRRLVAAALVVLAAGTHLTAQQTPAPGQSAQQSATPPPLGPPPPALLAIEVEPSGETATLTYFNRPIVVLRARIMGRRPGDRVVLGVRTLDNLVAAGRSGPVTAEPNAGGYLIGVGDQTVIGLTTADLDETARETLPALTERTVARMQQALSEANEARDAQVWVRAALRAIPAIVLGLVLLWLFGRLRRYVARTLTGLATRTVARAGLADQQAARTDRLLNHLLNQFAAGLVFVLQLTVLYLFVAFILRQFPYTRPWGETLRSSLIGIVADIAVATERALPGLLMVAAIVVIIRSVIALIQPWFDAVEQGMVKVEFLHPETAPITRKLFTLGLWLFAGALAYPYIPGSNTDAFKGISVFIGLMVTLGSSGLMNQITSGIMLTYSRALRLGDYVKVGDVEGTIIDLGMLSTKVKTLRSEEVTIPNAVVVSHTTTDYSRYSGVVRTSSFVTIGYDVPWRQVHAMLLIAAERTPGILREPAPRVFQTALEDSAVRYLLSICLEHQESRIVTLSVLHAHIQDLFNEHGVQIMTPKYERDPAAPKVVPKQDWFTSPASPERSKQG